MKRIHLVFLALSIMAPLTSFAQFSVTITVDENCNGLLTNTNIFMSAIPCAVLTDRGPGGWASALTYGLLNPPGMVAGDLLLLEPASNGVLSDLVRFNPGQNGGSLVFYSDNTDGADSLADTGFPTALYTNNAVLFEIGPEGLNGLTYTPTAGQPGFVAGAGGAVTYVIESDTVTTPEPSSFGLVIIGVGMIAGGSIRRLRRA
jgi:hypothetical protein